MLQPTPLQNAACELNDVAGLLATLSALLTDLKDDEPINMDAIVAAISVVTDAARAVSRAVTAELDKVDANATITP